MAKINMKKYPLLISLIVSCVIVITSLFIMGFFGMNIGTSLAGGSQFEVRIDSEVDAEKYIADIKTVLSNKGITADTTFVEDKANADGQENGTFTDRCIVIKIAKKGISAEKNAEVKKAIAEKLDIAETQITDIEEITTSIKSKNILFVGLAIGIVVVCLYVFGLIRYNVFAGLSFILAFLHNIILYLSILILSRVQLNLVSLTVVLLLTLAMSGLLIQIYEKDKENEKLTAGEKQTISERLISSEKQASVSYAFVAGALLVFAALMFIVPVAAVRFTAINILIALVVTVYTGLIIGPGVYAALLEMREMNRKAILSRNDAVNKEIKKKIKKAEKSISKK